MIQYEEIKNIEILDIIFYIEINKIKAAYSLNLIDKEKSNELKENLNKEFLSLYQTAFYRI